MTGLLMSRERTVHYMCDHSTTICGDCDGSRPATDPWMTFISYEAPLAPVSS